MTGSNRGHQSATDRGHRTTDHWSVRRGERAPTRGCSRRMTPSTAPNTGSLSLSSADPFAGPTSTGATRIEPAMSAAIADSTCAAHTHLWRLGTLMHERQISALHATRGAVCAYLTERVDQGASAAVRTVGRHPRPIGGSPRNTVTRQSLARTCNRSQPCATTWKRGMCVVRDEGALRPRRLRRMPGPRGP